MNIPSFLIPIVVLEVLAVLTVTWGLWILFTQDFTRMSWTAPPLDAESTRSRHVQAKTKHQSSLLPTTHRSPTNLSGLRLQRRQPSATIQRVAAPACTTGPRPGRPAARTASTSGALETASRSLPSTVSTAMATSV